MLATRKPNGAISWRWTLPQSKAAVVSASSSCSPPRRSLAPPDCSPRASAADAWSVIFWRGLFAAAFTIAYVHWRGKTGEEFRKMGRSGWAVAVLGASGTAAFIPAFKLTTIANVSLIYAAAPFFAAGIAWLWFKEVIERRVLIAALVAISA